MHMTDIEVPHSTCHPTHRAAHRLAGALALAATVLITCAAAQEPGGTGEATIVGVHYQDLLPSDGDTVQVFLPRPLTGTWDGVTLSSSHECLEVGALGDPGAGYALVLDVRLRGAAGAEGALESRAGCSAAIVATFRSGAAAWEGTTLVAINRLEHPPAPLGAIDAALTLDRIAMPLEPGTRPVASLVTLSLTNRAAEPVIVLGVADQEALTRLVGAVYQYDEPLTGTLADLEDKGRPLSATTLAPGATTNIALLLDPQSRLPDGSAVLTVQPSLLLDIAGATYSLRFERLSTAWGNELP